MSEKVERSEGGSEMYRHQTRDREFELAMGNEEGIEAIDSHIEKYVGKVETVFHEIISDLVHVDVHIVAPTPERNFYTLVTSGMSDRPMITPPQAKGWEYAELMICLPPTWKMTQEDFNDAANYWPIRWLKQLSRLPHEYDTWLRASHTVPNGDPAKPFAANTKLCCAYLSSPVLFDAGFQELKRSEEKIVRFFSVVPLYREEMDWKLKHGADSLDEKLNAIHVSELLNINRPNACVKKFNIFGWG